MTRTVCVLTGTRAEYGLLRPLMTGLEAHPDFSLRLVVTGSHLERSYGHTVDLVEADNLPIAARVPILQGGDDARAQCLAMACGVEGIGKALETIRPDLLVLLGDRYETMAAALAATAHRIPMAHLHGGERSEGVQDEQLRHAITKLSHLHFAASEEYRGRIIQLGEQPDRVHNVGAIGMDNIKTLSSMTDAELEAFIGFTPDSHTLLVTLHPEALERIPAETLAKNMFEALEALPHCSLVLTKANADPGGKAINQLLETHARNADPARVRLFDSMGQRAYLNTMRRCGAVVGNSSSGIIEAPAMQVPSVNIGERQKGRARTDSIIDCSTDSEAILQAIRRALSPDFRELARNTATPYGNGNTTAAILDILEQTDFQALSDKPFHDLEAGAL